MKTKIRNIRGLIPELVCRALKEDNAWKDITTRYTVPENRRIRAQFIAKSNGIICGLDIAKEVFMSLDRRCVMRTKAKDGTRVRKGQVFAEISGPASAILSGERTALNFLQHLSGIATMTGQYVAETKGKARILDTRKTLPGLRAVEKYAVTCGGGVNHRFDLSEMAMLKDNHLGLGENMDATVRRIRKAAPGTPVEIECDNLAQLREALQTSADIILLDNMGIPLLKKAVALVKEHRAEEKTAKPLIEISGGVTLATVGKYARLGVDRISVGAITHSVPALDISLEIRR